MQKIKCDISGQESEWINSLNGVPTGWARISFSYSFTRNEQFYQGNKLLCICPDVIFKLLPGLQPQPKDESFMNLIRGFLQDEIADALANQ